MTDREKAIVMAHTGICMLTGGKFQIFHKYVEDIMGRPILTHEMGIASIADEIKAKSKDDFIVLCTDESSSENPNKWIPVSDRLPEENKSVIVSTEYGVVYPDARYTKKYGWEWAYEAGADYREELEDEDVTAWMPLPEPYKTESEYKE